MFSKISRRVPHNYNYKFERVPKMNACGKLFTRPIALAQSVDLRSKMSPIENQGDLGSCTANAIAGCLEAMDATADFDVSRLFIYYNERLIEGDVNFDNGAFIHDGIKSLTTYGVADEKMWPYIVSKFRSKPTCCTYAAAAKRRVTQYTQISGLPQLQTALTNGFPVAFGFTVFESFESALVESTGRVPMPRPGEAILGGHAVVCVGYEPGLNGAFICRNSWGSGWGDKGYFYLPRAFIGSAQYCDDFWAITKAW